MLGPKEKFEQRGPVIPTAPGDALTISPESITCMCVVCVSVCLCVCVCVCVWPKPPGASLISYYGYDICKYSTYFSGMSSKVFL